MIGALTSGLGSNFLKLIPQSNFRKTRHSLLCQYNIKKITPRLGLPKYKLIEDGKSQVAGTVNHLGLIIKLLISN